MTDKTATQDTRTVTAWFAPHGTPLPQSLNEPLPDGCRRGGPINWRRFADSLTVDVQLDHFSFSAFARWRTPSIAFAWRPNLHEEINGPKVGERVTAVVEDVAEHIRVVLPDIEFTDTEAADAAPDEAGVWAYRYYKEPE